MEKSNCLEIGVGGFGFRVCGLGFGGTVNKDMSRMFWSAKSFKSPIGSWDTAAVKNMSGMFAHDTRMLLMLCFLFSLSSRSCPILSPKTYFRSFSWIAG